MLITFSVRFLVLGAYIMVPGAAALVALRFRFTSLLDAFIACAAIGVAWTSACVYVLLFFNSYLPFTAALIVLLPGAWLVVMLADGTHPLGSIRVASDPGDQLPIIDRLMMACVVTFLVSIFIDAATSPVTAWDGTVTWDKWATDWARRQNLYGYRLGGYPQLLPMFSSVLYKLTGAYRLTIPIDQYVLHATQVVFAFVLLCAIARLCRALRLPAWPAIALTFGHPAVRTAITNGSADLLLGMFTVSAIALLLTFIREKWDSRHGAAAALVPVLFGACFTKANGLLVLLYPLSYYLLQPIWLRGDGGVKRFSRSSLIAMVLLPVLAVSPFYIYQVVEGERVSPALLDSHEVNFPMLEMLPILQDASDRSFSEHRDGTRLREAGRRVGTSFELPTEWLSLTGLCSLVLFSVSFRRRLTLPLVVPSLIVAAIWYRATSYDLRNLLPALPVAAVLATAGATELRVILGRARAVLVVAAACTVLLAVFGGGVLLTRAASVTAMFRPDPSEPLQGAILTRRVAAMRTGADDRIRMFFPFEWPTYSWVKSLRPVASAEHIIAVAQMYRWFRRGSYPISLFYWQGVRPGDIFIGSSPSRPRFDDQWTLLRDADGFKVWILDVNPRIVPLADLLLTGPTPPRTVASTQDAITLSLNGVQGFVVHNVLDRDLRAGSSIVWQALVDSSDVTSAVRPGFLVYDAAIFDPRRTGVAVDILSGDQHLVALSGILTLSGKPLSARPEDRILVGIVSDGANATLHLRRFRVAIYR